ncbi:MAG: deoxyribodipyrimidine photo-lyase [Myxococcales bacterium]|nr:deoxyribodipyrimidine photo-lyase [Myxococcales bacterium]
MRTLVWFRGKDLRLADHAPLLAAIRDGEVVPLFVVDPFFFAPERARELPNRMQFLVDSLSELADAIDARGSQLLFAAGRSTDVVPRLAQLFHADRVVAHRWSEPFGIERDRRIAKSLHDQASRLELFEGETMAAPGQVLTGSGTPFSVFTPFGRAFAKTVTIDAPRPAPRALPPLPAIPPAVKKLLTTRPTLASIGITRNDEVVAGGERASRARLTHFVKGPAARYEHGRNVMGLAGTSRLSQDLKFGTLSARAVWHSVKTGLADHGKAWRTFANELVWREFAYDVLRSKPDVLVHPFRPAWEGFPWRDDEKAWRAWRDGTTGYPVVDAAARQLLAEGFVHNRARMIAASFLCKHLLLDFRLGEAHYMKHLTDGDWASNDLGWQWSAGCGVDAQPWFRVFNPVAQGERFDADGAYVRRWVPELAKVPSRWLHSPWQCPPLELRAAGVELGRTYPMPIIDHALARGRFLAAAEGHLRRTKS